MIYSFSDVRKLNIKIKDSDFLWDIFETVSNDFIHHKNFIHCIKDFYNSSNFFSHKKDYFDLSSYTVYYFNKRNRTAAHQNNALHQLIQIFDYFSMQEQFF